MKLEVQELRIDYKDGYLVIDADGEMDENELGRMSLAGYEVQG
jgi:hypothetical protein